MKLSINNFKSIKEIRDFTFNSINIITGVHNGGKTSFIQFLLLLKQTIEAEKAYPTLIFDGNLIDMGCYSDLVYKKDANNNISFELKFDNNDFINTFGIPQENVNDITLEAAWSLLDNNVILNKICFKYNTQMQNKNQKDHFIAFILENGEYSGKRFLIETHSDHFITRIRRRIAECNSNLYKKINMVFVEQRETEHLFHKLDLSDMGTFSYFPDDFVEQTDDYNAIIMAQVNKSLTKENK
ncbi:hypothetical protein AGMMS49982_06290 [Bacteroidia bacterium]|nr:hypothetical protein AGMMS49982_06290 [Bacteroidia bacterium]